MDNTKENNKKNAIELLITWSKWLISINFFAATGCAIVLKSLNDTAIMKVGAYLFVAVLFFALSVLCATLFTFCMVHEIRNVSSDSKIKFVWLAKIQWLLFAMGLFFLIIWIGILSKVI